MKIKIPANSIHREFYHIQEIILDDYDRIYIELTDGQKIDLPFRVGSTRYLKKGNNFKAAIRRTSGEVFDVTIFGKSEKGSLLSIEFETFIGSVHDLIELLYKYNFQDTTLDDFVKAFTLMCKNLYTSNHLLQTKIKY